MPDVPARAGQCPQRPRRADLYLPGGPRADGVTSDVIDAPDDELDRIVDEYPLDISAITDDRPFFWHFTDFATVLRNPQRDFQDAEIAIGERLLLMLLAMSAVVAAVLLWLPFAVTRRRHGRRPGCRAVAIVRLLRVDRPRLHARRGLDDPTVRPAARVPDAVALGVAVHVADRDGDRCPLLGDRPALAADRSADGGPPARRHRHRLPVRRRSADRSRAGVAAMGPDRAGRGAVAADRPAARRVPADRDDGGRRGSFGSGSTRGVSWRGAGP